MEIKICTKVRVSLFCILGIQFIFPIASAETSRDVERIVAVIAGQKTLRKEFSPISTAISGTEFTMKHPDKVINPKLESKTFTGLTLSELLTQSGMSTGEQEKLSKETISFIGRDGYTVAIPLKDALAAGAIVTALEFGKPMDWRKGAPFLAFRNINAAKYLAEPSWWGWWVSAVIVGQPKTSVSIFDKTIELAELKKLCPEQTRGILNYPRGRRLETPPRKLKGTITTCALDQIAAKVSPSASTAATPAATPAAVDSATPAANPTAAGTKGIVVDFLTGQTQTITDPSLYQLVFAFENKPISVSLGGPVQLCRTDGKKECQYFVSSIREAP